MDSNSLFLPSTSTNHRYQTNEPFNSSGTVPKTIVDDNKDYILSLESETNPVTFNLPDKFSNVQSIELLKSRIERGENTVEYYRNCPFITLFNNYFKDVVDSHLETKFLEYLGITNMNMPELISLLDSNTSSNIPLSRTINYNYLISSLQTIPWETPDDDYGQEYSDNLSLSELWTQFELNLAPYVLDTFTYTEQTLQQALNNISDAYHDKFQNKIPFILVQYHSDLNRFYFLSPMPFFLFPSNAHMILGLRPDIVYVSQLDMGLSYYYVWADFSPKLNGADVVYLQNDESMYSYRNPIYSSLSTIYLPDTGLYPYLNINDVIHSTRPIQMISKSVNKLTFSLYTNLDQKFLYQNNGKKWYIDICLRGKCT